MTIRKTAFDTTALDGYQIGKPTEAIKIAYTNGQLQTVDDSCLFLVERSEMTSVEIPAFAHPLAVDFRGEPGIVIDVRSFGVWDSTQYRFVVKNTIEHSLALLRGRLSEIWMTGRTSLLRDISPLPLAVYTSWISEAIAKRFALDPHEQLNMAIFSGIFYCSLFTNNEAPDETEKLRMANSISRALRVTAQDVLRVMDQVYSAEQPIKLTGIIPFCQMAEEITGSVRLKGFNAGLLIATLGGTWFGNKQEFLGVALEHPPTWLTILMAAFSERTFKNTIIARITERSSGKESGKDYVRAVLNLIETRLPA